MTNKEVCDDDVCELPDDDKPVTDSSSFEPGPGKHVLFFGDPMCSWCWGFAPELEKLAETIKDRAQLHIIMGGLRPGTTESWKGEMQSYIRHHWEEVENKTGQPFDFERLDDDDFIYDTEPSCRAVVSARELAGEKGDETAMHVYHALQRGFYAEGKDVTDTDAIADIAAGCGVDREKFLKLFTAPAAGELTMFDFQRARAFGVKGFPSIVCADDGQYAFLTLGYRTFAAMQADTLAWLDA